MRCYVKWLLIVIAVLNSNYLFSQQSKLNFKEGEESKVFDYSYGLLGDSINGFVTIENHKKSFDIQGYDVKQMKPVGEVKKYELTTDEKNFVNVGAYAISNKYYLLYYTIKSPNSTTTLYAREIDVKNKVLNEEPIELLKEENPSGAKVKAHIYFFIPVNVSSKKLGNLIFDVLQDEEKNSLVITYSKNTNEDGKVSKNVNQTIAAVSFDKNLSKLWGNNVEIPYTTKDADIIDKYVDAKGSLYVVVEKNVGRKEKHLKYELFKFNDKKSFQTVLDFTKKNADFELISDEFFFYEHEGQTYLLGKYFLTSYNHAVGFFMLQIEEKGKKLGNAVNLYPFDMDVINKYESAKTQSKIAKGKYTNLNNLRLKKVAMSKDGSVRLFAEEYSVETTTSSSSTGRMTYAKSYYYYNDIYVMDIKANKINWFVKIPRSIVLALADTYWSSFNAIQANDGVYVLYTDNESNLDILESEKTPNAGNRGVKNMYMTYTFISNDGKVTKKQLSDDGGRLYGIRYLKKVTNNMYFTTRLSPALKLNGENSIKGFAILSIE